MLSKKPDAVCYVVGLFFDPEDEGDIFLGNIC
jgi:hypothetical protein